MLKTCKYANQILPSMKWLRRNTKKKLTRIRGRHTTKLYAAHVSLRGTSPFPGDLRGRRVRLSHQAWSLPSTSQLFETFTKFRVGSRSGFRPLARAQGILRRASLLAMKLFFRTAACGSRSLVPLSARFVLSDFQSASSLSRLWRVGSAC